MRFARKGATVRATEHRRAKVEASILAGERGDYTDGSKGKVMESDGGGKWMAK